MPWLALLAIALPLGAAWAAAPSGSAPMPGRPEEPVAMAEQVDITCEIDLRERTDHIARVTVTLTGLERDELELALPEWTTGGRVHRSSGELMELTAEGPEGLPLELRRVGPVRWRIATRSVSEVVVRYWVWANDPSPQGAQIDSRHAYLNPAAILLYPPDLVRRPVTIRLRMPAAWKAASTLEPTFDPSVFRASSFLEVFESPFEVAAFEERFFTIREMNVTLVTHDTPAGLDRSALLQGLERLLDQAIRLFGIVPSRDHLFVFHFDPGGAREALGLPGATSVRWGSEVAGAALEELLRTTLEGFLKAWLGGRVRPAAMQRVFLTEPFVTDSYWFLDGAAAYYTELLMVRAGRTRPERFYERLGSEITRLQNTTARTIQSAAEASLDAWYGIEAGYQAPERSIDYRNKGFLLCFLLDLEMRRATEGRRSLDDLLALLAGWYGRSGRAFEESADLLLAAGALARMDATPFLDRYVLGTEELPWDQALETAGLALRPVSGEVAATGFRVEPEGQRVLRVASVVEGSPAARAGLRGGDRIVAVNGSLLVGDLTDILSDARPGDIMTVRIRRGSREEEISFPLTSEVRQSFRIEALPETTPAQQAVLATLFSRLP